MGALITTVLTARISPLSTRSTIKFPLCTIAHIKSSDDEPFITRAKTRIIIADKPAKKYQILFFLRFCLMDEIFTCSESCKKAKLYYEVIKYDNIAAKKVSFLI